MKTSTIVKEGAIPNKSGAKMFEEWTESLACPSCHAEFVARGKDLVCILANHVTEPDIFFVMCPTPHCHHGMKLGIRVSRYDGWMPQNMIRYVKIVELRREEFVWADCLLCTDASRPIKGICECVECCPPDDSSSSDESE